MSTKKLGDLRLSMSVRDIIVAIADGRVKKLRPEDRYAIVQSVDYMARKATVRYYNGTNDIVLPFTPAAQPDHVGQLVRVSGGVANRYISALIDPPVVVAPTLTNGWVDFGGTNTPSGYRRDAGGRVHLRGSIKSGTAGQAAFTLPVGFRPSAQRTFIILQGSNTGGRLDVFADGTVVPHSSISNVTQVTLNQVSFEGV